MFKKWFGGGIELKADGPPGSFRATFATLNVIDHDGDVTVPGAFKDGQSVRIAQWGHNWAGPAIGKGVIHADQERAWVDGQFFLGMPEAVSTYESVKGLGDLAEWSYGFDVTQSEPGQFEGQSVRYLKGLQVHEVSPVMLGAGIGTGTDAIKSAAWGESEASVEAKSEFKPQPTEHACRLADPARYDRFRRVNGDRSHNGKKYDVIYGHAKDGGAWEQQAFRYPKETWTAAEARSHCGSHSGTFEAARTGKAAAGSFEDLRSRLQEELIEAGYQWAIVATYPDSVICCAYGGGYDPLGGMDYYRLSYSLDAAGKITFGAPEQVQETFISEQQPAGGALSGPMAKDLSYDDHSEHVRVAVREWIERTKSGSELRAKEGRAISEARRGRMATVRDQLRVGADEIDGLLAETEPKPKEADPALRAEFLRYQRLRAHQLVGV